MSLIFASSAHIQQTRPYLKMRAALDGDFSKWRKAQFYIRQVWENHQSSQPAPTKSRINIGLLKLKTQKLAKRAKGLFKRSSQKKNPRLISKTVYKAPSFTSLALGLAINLVSIFIILVAGIYFAPDIIYSIFPPATQNITNGVETTALGGNVALGASASATPETRTLPEFNPDLPQGAWLSIPVIGLNGQIHITEDSADALDEGIWLDPEFGRPSNPDLPVVLAAHRYGWKWWWQDDYWKYNSFYLLPDTQVGDIIEITFGQRKYVYEIYKAEEGTEVHGSDADLILYTCKYLNSPLKHFRYARLIDLGMDSQG